MKKKVSKIIILFIVVSFQNSKAQLSDKCDQRRPMAEWDGASVSLIGSFLAYDQNTIAQLSNFIKEAAEVSRVLIPCNIDDFDQNGKRTISCIDIETAVESWNSSQLQSQVEFIPEVDLALKSAWLQDYFPHIIYLNGEISLVRYDYAPLTQSTRLAMTSLNLKLRIKQLLGLSKLKMENTKMFLDGGNLISDGNLVAFSCNINYVREEYLQAQLGIKKLYILESPTLGGNSTNHIDTYLKLVNKNTVLISECPTSNSTYRCGVYAREKARFIQGDYKTSDNANFNVFTLPVPYPEQEDGDSPNYTNSMIVNNKVIIPLFNEPTDQIALDIYRTAMPGYDVVGVYFKDIITNFKGGMRCLSKVIGDPNGNRISFKIERNSTEELKKTDTKINEIQVYPNPMIDNTLVIESVHSWHQNIKIDLRNTLGQKVFDIPYFSNENKIMVKIPEFEAGVYYLIIKTLEKSWVKKIIIR